MILVEIIQERIEKLIREDEDLNIVQRRKEKDRLNGNLEVVSKFIEILESDHSAITFLDTRKLLDVIEQNLNLFGYNLENSEMYIETIKRVYYEMKKGKEVKLNSYQRIFMHKLMEFFRRIKQVYEDSLKQLMEEYESDYSKHQTIEDEILEFQALLEKICSPDNKELLTLEDLELLDKIKRDETVPFERKKQMLLAFIEYNKSISRKNEKVSSKTDVETVKRLFVQYGIDSSIINSIDKYKDEIVTNANIENIKEILEYFKRKNILNEFDPSSLLVVAVYGNLNHITHTYENIVMINGNPRIFFETPSLWIANVERKEGKRRRHRDREEKTETHISLLTAAREISLKEIFDNIEFLNDIGFKVDINDQDGYKVALRTPNYRLRKNYEECSLYGFFQEEIRGKRMSSVLSYFNIMDCCDRFIELGLHDYIIKHPTGIQSFKPETFAFFYKLMKDNTLPVYHSKIYSKSHTGYLSTHATKELLGNSIGDVEEFLKDNDFIDQRDPRYIPNYVLYEEAIFDNDPLDIDASVFNNPIVMKLESEFKVNDYTYIIGEKKVEEEDNFFDESKIEEKLLAQYISRPKFLRILSMLESNPQFTGNDKEIFALTYGYPIRMPLTKEMFDFIAKEIGYDYKAKEEQNGLPFKI